VQGFQLLIHFDWQEQQRIQEPGEYSRTTCDQLLLIAVRITAKAPVLQFGIFRLVFLGGFPSGF